MTNNDNKKIITSDLPEEFIDALQEVGNIGSGHAANALADILNRRVDMTLPKFNFLTLDQLSTYNWGNEDPLDPYAFVMLESTGDFKFIVLVVFDKNTLVQVLKLVSGDDSFTKDMSMDELSKFDQSTITEIGNILGLHYLTAIGEFLGFKFNAPNLKINIMSPELYIETSETVLISIASLSESDFVHIINIECDIFTSDEILHPAVVLIPEEATIQKSLKLMFGDYMD